MTIYHLAWQSEWNDGRVGDRYRHASLETEGFIHCTREPELLLEVANRFFVEPREEPLLLLEIDEARVGSEVRDEVVEGGLSFPHVYGPIAIASVLAVRPMRREDDRWALSDDAES